MNASTSSRVCRSLTSAPSRPSMPSRRTDHVAHVHHLERFPGLETAFLLPRRSHGADRSTRRNAHVTKAGGITPARSHKEKQRRERTKALLSKSKLVGGQRSAGTLPRRVGGKRPPQLRHMRKFGLRAFAGASEQRLKANAALLERIDSGFES